MKNWFLNLLSKPKKMKTFFADDGKKTDNPVVLSEIPEATTVIAEISEEGANNAVSSPVFTITTKTEYTQEERKQVGKLSHLDFGNPEGELGCFLNYKPRALYPPSERQLNYLKDLGVFIPDGITNIDASCMISRATDEDSLESPRPSLVTLASGLGIGFSAFIGSNGLFSSIVTSASTRDRAALYAYAVRQSMRGKPFGNMLEDPDISVFYSFADKVIADPTLTRSLEGRTADDFRKPYRGTAIYKEAVAYLTEHKGENL